MDSESSFKKFIDSLAPYYGRLIFTALGLAAAITFMRIGFVKTMLVLICCGIGYVIGACRDNAAPEWLLFWLERRR